MAGENNFGSTHGDSGVALFEADALAFERYEGVFRSEPLSPEQRLILAVLDDAVQSFIAGIRPRNGKEQRRFEEAQSWIMKAEAGWVFSFESICDQLGLDPDYLRSGLEKLRVEAHRGRRVGAASSHRPRHARTPIRPGIIRLPT
jgi:hypothetical protein